MSERQEQYTATVTHQSINIVSEPAVTITVSAEWADFLARAQAARKEWRSHCVESIAVVDWRNLEIGKVIAFERT